MKFLSVTVLFILPALSYGAIVIGGKKVHKVCEKALKKTHKLHVLVADPDHCASFYKCSPWFQAELSCKYGQHFSSELQKCTDPCTAACDKDLVCPTEDPGSGDDAEVKLLAEASEAKPAVPPKKTTTEKTVSAFLKDDSSEEDLPGVKKEDDSSEEDPKPAKKTESTQAKKKDDSSEEDKKTAKKKDDSSEEDKKSAKKSESTKAKRAVETPTKLALPSSLPSPTEAPAAPGAEAPVPFWQKIVDFFSKPPAEVADKIPPPSA